MPGLAAGSCSYGRPLATASFSFTSRLRLAGRYGSRHVSDQLLSFDKIAPMSGTLVQPLGCVEWGTPGLYYEPLHIAGIKKHAFYQFTISSLDLSRPQGSLLRRRERKCYRFAFFPMMPAPANANRGNSAPIQRARGFLAPSGAAELLEEQI